MKKSILIVSMWMLIVGFLQINLNQVHAQSGHALELSGEVGNSNVSISGLPLTTLPYTMEMWFKPEGDQPDYAGLLVNPTNNNGIVYVGWQGDEMLRLNATTDNGDGYAGPTLTHAVATGEWHHVVAIVTDTSRTLILDGTSYTEKADFTAEDFSVSETFIGYYGVDTRVFKGLVDEVRVWDVARTEQEINDSKSIELTGSEAGLVAYYNFNDETANDLTSNAANGVVTGGSFFDLDAAVLSLSTDEAMVETAGYGYPVTLTTENISTLSAVASAGFTVTPSEFTQEELEAGDVSIRIFAEDAAGTTGTVILSNAGGNLDTIQLTTVEYADRYLIKQLESGLFLGTNTDNAAQPALADSTAFASQTFFMQSVNEGVNDSLYYLIQDSTYTYLSKKTSSGWSTVYGALEDGIWKVVLGDDGHYTIYNTVKGYLATDGTTVNSSFYADKGLSPKAQFTFYRVPSSDASLASLTVNAGMLDPMFDDETMGYSVMVPYGELMVTIDAVASSKYATVAGAGAIDLTETSSVDVVVTAETGEMHTYTVNFTIAAEKFVPETEVDYYFVQNVSGLVLAESAEDARARLQEPALSSAEQVMQFMTTDVEGEYLIKNTTSGYLCYYDSWKMGFVSDTTGIASTCTFIVVTEELTGNVYLQAVDKSETQYVSTDNSNVGSGVFPDKGMSERAQWDITKADDMVFTPVVTISESVRVDVEKGLKSYPLTIAAVNVVDNMMVELPEGFTADVTEILPSSFADGAEVTILIDAPEANIGDAGNIEFTLNQDDASTTVASVAVNVVAPYTRYFIKQNSTGLVMGSSNDEFVPSLSEMEDDNDSLLFILKPINLGVDDSLFYIVQDVDYRYFSWSNVNNWDTKLGALERGEWKIVADTGYVSIMNVESSKYVATDGTTVGSRYYADKSLEGNANAIFELVEVLSDDASLSSLTLSAGDLSPEFATDVYAYEVTLPAGSSTLDITAIASDDAAMVEGAGTIDLVADITVVEVMVTAASGDQMTYTITVAVKGTSVDRYANNEFKVYPTVSDSYFTMKAAKGSTVTVYNVTGKLVKQIQVQSELTKFELPKVGLYIVKSKDKVVRITRIN